MSGVEDMLRRRQQNQRKPPPRHPRPKQVEETPEQPNVVADTQTGGAANGGAQNGPEPTGAGTGPQGGGNQTEQQDAGGEKGVQAPKTGPKPKAAKPAAKKPPASKRGDENERDQERGAAVVALRGEAERKLVEVAALEWAAAARKLSDKDTKLRAAVDAATKAGTPPELVVAALVQAEGRAGHKVPDQVRSLAEGQKQAR